MPKPRKYIGDCSVDSGILMISDPCYVLCDPDDDQATKDSKPTYSKTTEALFLPYVTCEGSRKAPKESVVTAKDTISHKRGVCPECGVVVDMTLSVGKDPAEWEFVIEGHRPYHRQTVEDSGCRTPDNLGVEFFPGWGDGSYPVFLEYDEDGRVIRAVIECDWSEEFNEELSE